MAARGAVEVLRERIGHEATDALFTIMNESNRSMAEEMVRTIGDRFERRVAEEVSTLRVEMHEGLAGMRVEMHEGLAGMRVEMHADLGELRAEMHAGLGELRGEMYSGFGELRAEMHNGFGELRAGIATGREGATRWMFLFWVGQLGAIGGMLAYLK